MTSLQQTASLTLNSNGKRYRYYSIPAVAGLPGLAGFAWLPCALQVLVEGMLRHGAT